MGFIECFKAFYDARWSIFIYINISNSICVFNVVRMIFYFQFLFSILQQDPAKYDNKSNKELLDGVGGVEQTTAVVVRGMRGMSSMGKPQRPASDIRSTLMGQPKSQQVLNVAEFTCTCTTGWTGSTCEISECFD